MLQYLRRLPSKETRIANAMRADPAIVGYLDRLLRLPGREHLVAPHGQP